MNFWNKTPDKGWTVRSWIPLLLIGITFLLLGVFREQFADIYRKAVMICLECIGIG